jgi:riboflavin kinase / FMN adenylyltransferase
MIHFHEVYKSSHDSGEDRAVCAVLGNFDGLHRGHQRLLSEANNRASARSLEVVAITFHPHPLSVLRPCQIMKPLCSVRQKLVLLHRMGAERVIVVRFTKSVADISAETFALEFLIQKLGGRYVVLGEDAGFGRDREAGPEQILSLMRRHGADGEIVPFVADKEQRKVGSRHIREAIEQGDLVTASWLLGRPYSLSGRIVRGAGRGGRIGLPTLNMKPNDQLYPPHGVYSGFIAARGEILPAVFNLGVRPTFDNGALSIEGHSLVPLSNNSPIRHAEFFLTERIRNEMKFDSVERFLLQVEEDKACTRTGLQNFDSSALSVWTTR